MSKIEKTEYTMTISRLTVDKLGVKLYDRVSAVIAEIVANCYDADAKEVEIKAPMGELLSTKKAGKICDRGFEIEVKDNGIGMTPDEVNGFYLIVGAERRNDTKRGDKTKLGRLVMGRKGVGKLAPFGICQKIEIISAGGEKVSVINPEGEEIKGYLTAHLILDKNDILSETDEPYHPNAGEFDGTISLKSGTIIRLKIFDHRKVPQISDFERQLAQRFGLPSSNWQIKLIDSIKTPTDPEYTRTIGEFSVEKMENTEIQFKKNDKTGKYYTIDTDDTEISDIEAGFNHEGIFYPIMGWVSYSKQPYKDDLMAGIRIYCRGKIAAQTHIFNLKAGFTGEYDIRSYLIGALHADWIDDKEDLIRTDRQDILWSHELGQAFEKWGQALVKKIGKKTREPKRKKAWDFFKEISNIEDKVQKAFPAANQKEIRENTLEMAKTIARNTREDEFNEPETIDCIVNLSMLLGPHITLDEKLREAAESEDSPLSIITSILKTARIAELSSFGKIAYDRVNVIKKVEELKDEEGTIEAAFQNLITQAPWLINPQWAPITANQTFETLKKEFQKFYKIKTGEELVLDNFDDPQKRTDFVMSNQDKCLEIIEIKKPNHGLTNEEMDRIIKYIDLMEEFLKKDGNQEFQKLFPNYHVTIVCDKISLYGAQKKAFDGLRTQNPQMIEHLNWSSFLLNTKRMHQGFLDEAEKQKRYAIQQQS